MGNLVSGTLEHRTVKVAKSNGATFLKKKAIIITEKRSMHVRHHVARGFEAQPHLRHTRSKEI
jgi:phage gp16-like protein